jgi:hypothetical protein
LLALIIGLGCSLHRRFGSSRRAIRALQFRRILR